MAPLFLLAAMVAFAGEIPSGRIVDEVPCAAEPAQSYALYVPSSYTPERAWPVIFAFDPGARGRIPVERYQAAAEKFGYIVAGSRNSRNGSWEVSLAAARAMATDMTTRFRVDTHRLYTAGMSGGARVALGVALGSGNVAGVIASSAGYPDAKPRKTVPFAVFGTAGNEDFNYREMRRLDRELTSPHRLAVFAGGHVWLSSELALDAVEWMELQAMKSGLKPRDQRQIDAMFDRRTAAAAAQPPGQDAYQALQAVVADFAGLKDVSAYAARAAELGRSKPVRDAIKKDREEEDREQREIDQMLSWESQLSSLDQRPSALASLRDRWARLSRVAQGEADSGERRMARRVLRGLAMGVAERTKDPEYRRIVEEFRPAGTFAR